MDLVDPFGTPAKPIDVDIEEDQIQHRAKKRARRFKGMDECIELSNESLAQWKRNVSEETAAQELSSLKKMATKNMIENLSKALGRPASGGNFFDL